MSALDIVHRIVEKVAPGRPPAYSEAHVLKALELIGSALGIGRQRLSRELRLGEGTVRTLVKRMKGSGLVDVSRGGMTLTSRGNEILTELEERILTCEFPETSITVSSQNYAVLIKGAAGNVRRGIEQRDAALISGAKGATTLIYDGEQLLMPGTALELDNSTTSYILENLKPGKGDVIIIGSSNNLFEAEMGAKSAALKLLEETIDQRQSQ